MALTVQAIDIDFSTMNKMWGLGSASQRNMFICSEVLGYCNERTDKKWWSAEVIYTWQKNRCGMTMTEYLSEEHCYNDGKVVGLIENIWMKSYEEIVKMHINKDVQRKFCKYYPTAEKGQCMNNIDIRLNQLIYKKKIMNNKDSTF